MLSAPAAPGNTLTINNSQYRGASGKSAIFWQEGRFGGDWCSDEQLIKTFSEQSEVWVGFWIKFQPGWVWKANSENYAKIIRFTHYHGGSPISYFEGGNMRPIAGMHLYQEDDSNVTMQAIFRSANAYLPDAGTPYHVRAEVFWVDDANGSGTGSNFTASGEWQHWVLGVKMNSGVGAADGEYHFYVNGVLEYSNTTMPWIDDGGSSAPWNCVVVGGNDYNFFSDTGEQWYAIDDIVVATTYAEAVSGTPASHTMRSKPLLP